MPDPVDLTRLAGVKPVAMTQEYLRNDPDMIAWFAGVVPTDGSSDRSVRVSGVVKPPYPMLRVVGSPGGGSLRDVKWKLQPEIVVESWGAPDGSPGPDALEQLCRLAVTVLARWPDQQFDVWQPVVTDVDPAWPFPLDDPTGQPRWMSTAMLTLHPALDPSHDPALTP